MATPADPVRILIAEDSPTQAEQLRHILERKGYQVAVAGNGVQALTLLPGYKPGLVISDIVMPEMDGYELCRRIRLDTSLAFLPVVLLTALTDTKDVLEGLSCGADSFITKPYDADYLLVQVAQMLVEVQRSDGASTVVNMEVLWAGKKCTIVTDQRRTVSLLISTYEAAVRRNTELSRTQDELRSLNERLEGLVAQRTAELSAEIAVRTLTEETQRRSEERLRDLTFSIGDWVWETDKNGVYTFTSQRGHDYFGGDLIGKTPFELTPPDEAKRVAAIFSKIAADKAQIRDLEYWNIRRDGERVCLLTNGVPILDGQGNLLGYRGVDKDITDRKRSEQMIRSQLEELQRWQNVMLGREDRNMGLKREVNELLRRLGEPIRYPSQEGVEAVQPEASTMNGAHETKP